MQLYTTQYPRSKLMLDWSVVQEITRKITKMRFFFKDVEEYFELMLIFTKIVKQNYLNEISFCKFRPKKNYIYRWKTKVTLVNFHCPRIRITLHAIRLSTLPIHNLHSYFNIYDNNIIISVNCLTSLQMTNCFKCTIS